MTYPGRVTVIPSSTRMGRCIMKNSGKGQWWRCRHISVGGGTWITIMYVRVNQSSTRNRNVPERLEERMICRRKDEEHGIG